MTVVLDRCEQQQAASSGAMAAAEAAFKQQLAKLDSDTVETVDTAAVQVPVAALTDHLTLLQGNDETNSIDYEQERYAHLLSVCEFM